MTCFSILISLTLIKLSWSATEYTVGSFAYRARNVKRDTSLQDVPTEEKSPILEDDHTYYTSKFYTDNSAWIEISPDKTEFDKDVIHEGLSSKFRYAYNIKLQFVFPFYGLPLTSITPTTGGFIYVGDLVHRRLTETQYIAPLMAEFNPSLANDSFVYYYMDESKIIIQWESVYIHSTFKDGALDNKPFTFQAQLYKNGDIIFGYRDIPYSPAEIDSTNHYVKVGLAEAFYEVDTSHGITVTYIYQYHAVDMQLENITNNTEIALRAVKMCMESKSCAACTTHNTTFECTWCDELQQCSDGIGRWRQMWVNRGCPDENITDTSQCPAETEAALPEANSDTGYYEVILCEGSKTAVVCSGKDKLQIDYATFSRENTHGSVCQKPGDNDKIDCAFDKGHITEMLQTSCNGNSTCFVTATSQFFDLKDPCPNYAKTMFIYYKCKGPGSTGSKVFVGFLIICIVSLIAAGVTWFMYAYRNPTTPSGLFLIKYGRFWKKNPYKTDDADDSAI